MYSIFIVPFSLFSLSLETGPSQPLKCILTSNQVLHSVESWWKYFFLRFLTFSSFQTFFILFQFIVFRQFLSKLKMFLSICTYLIKNNHCAPPPPPSGSQPAIGWHRALGIQKKSDKKRRKMLEKSQKGISTSTATGSWSKYTTRLFSECTPNFFVT